MGKLVGKVAIITGAGNGQGRAAARLFAHEGGGVVIAEHDEAAGTSAAEEILASGGNALFSACDVANEDQVRATIERAISRFGRIDILYNNAAIYLSARGNYRPGITDGPSPLLEDNVWERTIGVNLKGVYLGCKFAIPQMRKVGGGVIINVSSIGALRVGRGGQSDAYTASKGGVMAMTRTLAVEHAQYNIRCNCIIPGWIDTNLAGPTPPDKKQAAISQIPLGRWGTPEDIAKMALFLACDDSSWITGQFFVVDGGWTAV